MDELAGRPLVLSCPAIVLPVLAWCFLGGTRWQWAEGSQRHLCVSELMMGDLICCLRTRLLILGLEEAEDLCAPGPHFFQTVCEEAGGRTGKRGPGAHPPTRGLTELPCRQGQRSWVPSLVSKRRQGKKSFCTFAALSPLAFFFPLEAQRTRSRCLTHARGSLIKRTSRCHRSLGRVCSAPA